MADRLSDERREALVLADAILDRPNADPDDDLAVLARHLLRAQESIDALSAKLAAGPAMPEVPSEAVCSAIEACKYVGWCNVGMVIYRIVRAALLKEHGK